MVEEYKIDEYKKFAIRLILLWTSDGNVIRMKPPKGGAKRDVDSAAIVIESPNLTPKQLVSIFGCPSVNDSNLTTRGLEYWNSHKFSCLCCL